MGRAVYRGRVKRRWEPLLAFGVVVWLLFCPICWFVLPGARFFAMFSLGVACLCALGIVLGRWSEKSQLGQGLLRMYQVCLLLGMVSFLTVEGLILSERGGAPEVEAQVLVVLGAGVNGETPSLALKTRIAAAADYLTAHPALLAVLSGGQGPGESITEAEAMRRALTERGIAAERLFLEERSTTTAENFRFSAALLKEIGVDSETAVVAVVSNDFHLYRARLLARREGLETVGVPAELPWFWLSANYYIREYFALIKAALT